MNKIGQLFSSLDIEKNDVTFIHRGRNKYLSGYFLKICGNDYNYDFRHNPKHKTLNLIFNFIKSVLFLY